MSLRARGALLAVVIAALGVAACGGGIFSRQYEYEEDLYLRLDGSGALIVNASVPALEALRGLNALSPDGRLERDRVRALFTTPSTAVTRVSRPWRRGGRQFIQVRMNIADIRTLGQVAPFAWSRYSLEAANGEHVFEQHVGASALRPGTMKNAGWDGSEIVAFRMHLPSRIVWHNARDLATDEPNKQERGNILRWEQRLTERLDGVPVHIRVVMESQSILFRTLWLFAGAFLAAVAVLGFVVWMTMRRGAGQQQAGPGGSQ